MIRYLDMLDALLSPGLVGLSAAFVESQVAFVASCQQPDGGFRGRLGESDLYYTDFALRILALLDPCHDSTACAAAHLAALPAPPDDVVHCFNLLNARRLLETCGHRLTVDESAIARSLHPYLLPTGGFARAPGLPEVSAYHTFLGALCFDCLGQPMPQAPAAVAAIQSLRRPMDDQTAGFSELASLPHPQTNATAAAVAFLGTQDAMTDADLSAVSAFLAAMQLPDGGLKAHPAASQSDLLSTFTGLLTLAMLEQLGRINVATAARFVRSAAAPHGGFHACPDDAEPDIEYTYYGLGSLALLRLFAQTR